MSRRLMESVGCLILLIFLMSSPMCFAGSGPGIQGVAAVSEVLEEGQKVTHVIINYSEPIPGDQLSKDSYSVKGRRITSVYCNGTGIRGVSEVSGQYVVIELVTSPSTDAGSTLVYRNDVNSRVPVRLTIRQTMDLRTCSGETIPMSEFTNTAEKEPIVEKFRSKTYVNPLNSSSLKYRFFVPEGYEVGSGPKPKLPLVIFLHGSGERGMGNDVQLLANQGASVWAEESGQAKHPCFVFAPQCPIPTTWAINAGTKDVPDFKPSEALENAFSAVKELMSEYDADGRRVYLTGLSMGSRGVYALGIGNPGFFAAQLNLCSADTYTDAQAARISRIPIWALVAEDDSTRPVDMRAAIDKLEKNGAIVVRKFKADVWNGKIRGPEAEDLALRQLADAGAIGANLLYTEYRKGTVTPSAHSSWMATLRNRIIREWLFSQVKGE